MNVYDRLGLKTRINGAGLLTRLGGSLMDAEVLDAMREAAGHFVDMTELQAKASEVIARHTGAEAGIVTSGAAAALTLAAAAALAGLDTARMERLPDTDGMANEILIFRPHRQAYDHAYRAAGAKLREIGFNDVAMGSGVRGLEPWEIESAITPATVAIAYTANPGGEPDLRMVAEVARRHGLPVIVDAAAQLPPRENLGRFIAEGASLVAFSGGKAIRGPQGSGILAGERRLVASALLQMIDMDVSPRTWRPPATLVPEEMRARPPHHGIGRGFKVDKESIVGLLVALDRFASEDVATTLAVKSAGLARLADALAGLPGVSPSQAPAGRSKRFPALDITVDAGVAGLDAFALSAGLQAHDPPVHLSERFAGQGMLTVDSAGLRAGDYDVVASAIRSVVKPRA